MMPILSKIITVYVIGIYMGKNLTKTSYITGLCDLLLHHKRVYVAICKHKPK